MGRGRQRAKHTKVARQLKYYSPDTDLAELERELGIVSDKETEDDPWAEYANKYNDMYDDEEDETDEANGAEEN